MIALKDINKGIIAPIYLFYGEEKYKFRVYKDALKKAVSYNNQMNFSIFEGKDIDFQKVYETAITLPFFAEKRLVIIENSGRFRGKKKGDKSQEEEESASSDEIIERIIDDLPETTCIAFFEEAVLKTKRIYKKIAAKGVVEECSADKPEDVKKWAAKGFRKYGLAIDRETMDLFIERTGTDYTALLHEIEKLASYATGNNCVTKEDVLAISTHNIESKIFDILSYMSCKNSQAVLERYADLLANREDPRMILAMIRRQFRIMLHTAELADEGKMNDEIAQITKNKPFVIKKMRSYLRYYRKEDILSILDEINRVDMQSKNGELDAQIEIELLLLKASS